METTVLRPKRGADSTASLRRILALFLILLLGSILRLAAMNGRVLLGDELGTALGVEKTYGYLMTNFEGWLTQPGYLLLAKLSSQVLGFSEFSIRFPSFLFGVLGIVAVYFLTTRLFNERAGMAAALLLALNPYHVFYSQMARAYATATTHSIFSFLSFFALMETRRRRFLVYYVLSTALAIYCHLGCAGVMIGQFLSVPFIVYLRRRDSGLYEILKPAALAMAIVSALVFCLYFPALRDIVQFRQKWSGEDGGLLTFGFVPLTLASHMGGRGWSIYVFSLFSVLGIVRLIRKNRSGGIVLLTWPLGVILFYWANAASHYPWAYARFFLIALPAMITVAAGGLVTTLDDVLDRVKVGTPIVACGYLALLPMFILMTSTKVIPISFGGKGVSWPMVVSYLNETVPPDMRIIHMDFRSSSLPFYLRYMSNLSNIQIADPRTLSKILSTGGDLNWSENPTIYIVDSIIFEDGHVPEGFVVKEFGTTLLLRRPDWKKSNDREMLVDLEMLTKKVIQCLEKNDVREIKNDWTYWRRDPESEENFVIRKPLVKYYMLLAAVQRRLGDVEQADRSLGMAVWWKMNIPAPGQIHSSWTMLDPHADFLEPLRQGKN
jgi:uncharacterized membrane protein